MFDAHASRGVVYLIITLGKRREASPAMTGRRPTEAGEGGQEEILRTQLMGRATVTGGRATDIPSSRPADLASGVPVERDCAGNGISVPRVQRSERVVQVARALVSCGRPFGGRP